MIPVSVTESVAVVTIPRYAEHSVESCLQFQNLRRHKTTVTFEPRLAPVRFAETMVVYGKDTTKKRYVSRTFYEPRVKPRTFAETEFIFAKDTTHRFASFLDYHIDECRKWFKTCMELKAKSFTSTHAVPHGVATSSSTSAGSQRDVISRGGGPDDVPGDDDGPGASQVFIPARKVREAEFAEKKFRVGLGTDKVDYNMNGPLINGF